MIMPSVGFSTLLDYQFGVLMRINLLWTFEHSFIGISLLNGILFYVYIGLGGRLVF